jgi:hypothetical protein
LKKEGRFTNSWVPTEQDEGTGNDAAPEYSVEFPNPCREARFLRGI